MSVRLLSILSLLIFPACFAASVQAERKHDEPSIEHHELSVELRPDSHELIGSDVIRIKIPDKRRTVIFSLASSLSIEQVWMVSDQGSESPVPLRFNRLEGDRIAVHLPDARSHWVIRWQYGGSVNDPPREPRHLRFVTPSETAGHIGAEGVYLSSESLWYPDMAGSLSSYELTVNLPAGWVGVSQGAQGPSAGRWNVHIKSEALTLVANQFVVKAREWTASNGQSIRLETYLFKEDASLADEYLDACARYLDAYIPLLGPYPFSKFAVVENFFSSGLGMPSFTLLGAAIVKRHYTQPYALGHEIVHSWIGNGVYNRHDEANWVEGLTTYLANYFYHELTGDQQQAKEQRRLMLLGYAVYVKRDQDYPISQFTRKTDEKDSAIGYQKTAMVFHMLRREMGEEKFWAALKELTRERMGAYADWSAIETIFSRTAEKDLGWFFDQWVKRSGAPRVAVTGAGVSQRTVGASETPLFESKITVTQQAPHYRVPVDLQIDDGHESRVVAHVPLDVLEDTVSVSTSFAPRWARLDPNFELFRRLERDELPAMLNLYVTDTRRTVVLFSTKGDAPGVFGGILQRIEAQEGLKPAGEKTLVASVPLTVGDRGSMLLLGHAPGTAPADLIHQHCGNMFSVTDSGFRVAGRAYDGPTFATLVSCPRSDVRGSVVSILYGNTPEAVTKIARLLFFYGWQSYVVFDQGAVVVRGDWDMSLASEVMLDHR